MAIDFTNNINSAIVSGTIGLQRADQGLTSTALNIAQRNQVQTTPEQLLSDAATQQIGQVKQLLPSANDSLANDLISLQINGRNAAASAKVLDVVNDTVGRIIDELA